VTVPGAEARDEPRRERGGGEDRERHRQERDTGFDRVEVQDLLHVEGEEEPDGEERAVEQHDDEVRGAQLRGAE
jgi:hypothetical protein